MIERGKISSSQLTTLIITTILSTSILFVPSITAHEAKEDGWISVLIGVVWGIGVVLIITALSKRFPKQTLIEYSCDIVGWWLGKFIAIIYIVILIISNIAVFKEFSALLNIMFLPKTPSFIISFLLVALGAFGVSKGLEVIARTNDFIFPIFIISSLVIVLLVVNEMDYNLLLPILAKGFIPVLKGAITPTTWFGETFLMIFFLPFLNNPNEGRKAGIIAVFVIALIQLLVLVSTLMVFGPEISANQSFAFLRLARYIGVAEFLSRVEPLIMLIWVTGITIKVCVFYYATVMAVTQFFGRKDYQPFILPFGVIFLILTSFLFKNSVELTDYLTKIWPFYEAYWIEGVIPLLLLIIAVIRKKGVRKIEK